MSKAEETTPDTFERMASWRVTGGAIEAAPGGEAAAGDDGLTAGGYTTSFCPVMAPDSAGDDGLTAGGYTTSFCPVMAPNSAGDDGLTAGGYTTSFCPVMAPN